MTDKSYIAGGPAFFYPTAGDATPPGVAKVLLPKDYLRLWLTGEHVAEMSDAAGTSWLDTGARDWSVITHDDSLLAGPERKCAYCGKTTDLSHEHLVSSSLAINEKCPNCDTIQTLHNKVWACRTCNAAKGTLGLYQFYQRRSGGKKRFEDSIPSLLEKKYLKVVYDCLDCAKCLDEGDMDGDGRVTVLDIDYAIQQKGRLWNVLL